MGCSWCVAGGRKSGGVVRLSSSNRGGVAEVGLLVLVVPWLSGGEGGGAAVGWGSQWIGLMWL